MPVFARHIGANGGVAETANAHTTPTEERILLEKGISIAKNRIMVHPLHLRD
jgi:hypothetical protein